MIIETAEQADKLHMAISLLIYVGTTDRGGMEGSAASVRKEPEGRPRTSLSG